MPNFRQLFLVILFISLVSIAAMGQKPLAAVSAFYKFDRSHSQTFNRRNIDARKEWFSSQLYGRFLNELKREKEYLRTNPGDKPHFGDGLPFQPMNEPCEANGRKSGNSYTLGRVNERGKNAKIGVNFAYPKACKMDKTLFTVNLIKEKGRWVINDIQYPDDMTLVEDLKRPVY